MNEKGMVLNAVAFEVRQIEASLKVINRMLEEANKEFDRAPKHSLEADIANDKIYLLSGKLTVLEPIRDALRDLIERYE
jgi:hypothetical protein